MARFALPFCLVALTALATGPVIAADELHFSPDDIHAWPTRSFEGETEYRLVERDGTRVLQARARQQASAKYLEKEVALDRTPYLHWCWQVSGIHRGLDETTRAGDDYPARVYVARKTGILPWQVQSVNYVWASSQPAGADWPNAFTSRARLLALQGGASRVGEWVAEVRDVREDFETLFGESTSRIDGVAVMSDGDNAGVDATAWFTHLGFSASDEPPGCPERHGADSEDR